MGPLKTLHIRTEVWPPPTQRPRLKLGSSCVFLAAILIFTATAASSTGLGPKYRTAYACEGSTLNMDCEQGHEIDLIRANYGRFSLTICNEHGNTEWRVDCMSHRTHRILHDRCSQKQNCSILAATRGFGDPCPGTLKYLEAQFQCLPVNPPSHTARPQAPWNDFAPKSTPTTLTDGRAGVPPHGQSFPSLSFPGPPASFDSENDRSVVIPPTTTTTTLTPRPPPWLVPNVSRNLTTPSTLPPTTTPTPSTSTTSTVTSAMKDVVTSSIMATQAKASADEVAKRGSTIEREPSKDDSRDKKINGVKKVTTTTSTTVYTPAVDSPSTVATTHWCASSSGRGLFWNWTRAGEEAVQPCPSGAQGYAKRICRLEGWAPDADLGECRSVWISTLLHRAKDKGEAVLAVASDLARVTREQNLYGGDVTAAARLVDDLTTRMGEEASSFPDAKQLEALVTDVLREAVATAAHLLRRQRPAWQDLRPADRRAALTKLLLGLEHAAFFLADTVNKERTIKRAEPNILMRLQVVETRSVAHVTFPSSDDSWYSTEGTDGSYDGGSYQGYDGYQGHNGNTYDRMFAEKNALISSPSTPSPSGVPPRHLQDFISLPPEALLENADNGLVKMVFFSYDGLQDLLQPETTVEYVNNSYKKVNRTRIVNSRVLSASLAKGRHVELSQPVYITFAMIRRQNVTNPACVFWDYTTSSWSEEGCRIILFNGTHATCRCDHLTNFAVLMDVHATPVAASHQVALSVITYVGCVISIVGLLLATVVFHAFRGLKSDRTTIHKNLCICLLLGEAIFVGGIARTDQPLVCSLVAGFLHYFFLAAFAWMFLEGFQLYMMLIEVFETEKSRVRWYYLTAYGLPAIVVGVSAAIDHTGYGSDVVCWLRTDNYFIFAFVGPVLVVIVANSVFLALSLMLMCRHAQNSAALKNKETTKLASLRTSIRGAVILMVLLGLTWTFGLLYLDEASVVMAYVFTVLNSLQGLFIFVFHCLQNDKVRKEVKRLCRRHARSCPCAPVGSSAKDSSRSSCNRLAATLAPPHAASSSLTSGLSGLSSARWRSAITDDSLVTSAATVGSLRPVAATMGTINSLGGGRARGSLARASHTSTGSRASRRAARTLDVEEEKYSFQSCGRDSGHGGSEQEESPRTAPMQKSSSLRLNNNVCGGGGENKFAAAAALEHSPSVSATSAAVLPDYRLAAELGHNLRYTTCGPTYVPGGMRCAARNQSPWNHTYTEIADGGVVGCVRATCGEGPDPVYEEIEREGRSEIQVSDLSDEDGRRHSSDISRQSSRSYGDHRPLLPYTLPDRCPPVTHATELRFAPRLRTADPAALCSPDGGVPMVAGVARLGSPLDHTVLSGAGHAVPLAHPIVNGIHTLSPNGHISSLHHYPELLGHNGAVVQPLSEPNLRNWEAVQRHRDLQQLQHLGEMTVAVLNGEQVVCKLKSPLAPIHENASSSQATTAATATVGPGASTNGERFMSPQAYSHC